MKCIHFGPQGPRHQLELGLDLLVQVPNANFSVPNVLSVFRVKGTLAWSGLLSSAPKAHSGHFAVDGGG